MTVELVESQSRLHRMARRLAQAMLEERKPAPAIGAAKEWRGF